MVKAMSEALKLHYIVDGDDFTSAGEASSQMKRVLKQLGVDGGVIRRAAIAMYEGEINMVIHANGGEIDVEIEPERITMILRDRGPGIPDVAAAMKEGFSTAPDQIRSLGFGAGMGLPNIKRYTDSLEIQTELGVGTTLTMTVNVVPQA